MAAAADGHTIRYDTRCHYNVRSKANGVIYRTDPTTKTWKTEKLESKKTDMLRSVGEQSGESVESVLKKKRKAAVGRICRKVKF